MRPDRRRRGVLRVDLAVEHALRRIWRRVRTVQVPTAVSSAVFAAVALADALFPISDFTVGEAVTVTIAVVAMFFRRRFPFTAWLATMPALFTENTAVASIVATVTLAAATRRVWVLIVASVVMFLGYSGITWMSPTLSDSIPNTIYGLLFTLGPVAIGLLARLWRESTDQVTELRRLRAVERDQAAAAALQRERAVLAREMHDVVAHQVSLIAVQASAMQFAGPDDVTRGFARTIRELCVTTLEELREMVRILRASGGSDRSTEPQPVLADLDRLIAGSGLAVRTALDLPDDLAVPHQRAVYRFVQEGLTNARKHAPGAPVAIVGTLRGGIAEVVMTNGAGTGPRLSLPGSGMGLVGLRERASLLHGTVEVTRSDAQFAIVMRIPAVRREV